MIIGPFSPVDVGGAPSVVLALASPLPNPSSRSTAIGHTRSRAGANHARGLRRLGSPSVDTRARRDPRRAAHVARWDGTDSGGQRVKSSIYFVRLEALGRVFTRRVAMFQ